MNSDQLVNVFPISAEAFGLHAGWFQSYLTALTHPTYELMVLFLVISVGVMALKRFEGADLEKKAWNLPVIISIVVMWPILIVGLKSLIDNFNTFLVHEVFQIP